MAGRFGRGLAALGLVALSCGGSPKTKPHAPLAADSAEVRPPDWFGSGGGTRFPRETYLVGVGACGPESGPIAERPSCAAQRAKEQLVLGVRANVKAIRERSVAQRTYADSTGQRYGEIHGTLRQLGSSEGSFVLESTLPREQHCDAQGTCYALVAIEREELAKRLLQKVEGVQREFDQLQSGSHDVLTTLSVLARMELLAQQLDEQRDAVAAVLGPDKAPPLAAERLGQLRSQKIGRAPACLALSMGERLDPGTVMTLLRAALADAGFSSIRIAKSNDCMSADLGVIAEATIGAPLESNVEAGYLQVNINGTIQLVSRGTVLGATKELRARGIGRTPDQAEHEAVERLSKAIRARVMNSSDL